MSEEKEPKQVFDMFYYHLKAAGWLRFQFCGVAAAMTAVLSELDDMSLLKAGQRMAPKSFCYS